MATYAARLRGWAARHGAAVEDVRYPRPPARGETAALRLTPAAGAAARAVVVHGAGNDAVYLLLELFRALLRGGVEVFAFDVDGHGTESTTVFDAETVRGCVAEAVAEAERPGALPLHLVGHSLGGALVLDALASGVPRVASAAALTAPLEVHLGPRTIVSELAGFFRRETLSQREHHGLWGLVPAFGPVKRASYPFRRVDAEGGPFGYVGTVRRLLRVMRLEERAASIRVPTLLVYSRGDHLAGHADGEILAARIPECELLTLERPSHYGVAFAPAGVRRTTEWILQRTPVPR
jgi:alpha-beta hydrolase superfamily lysophospholipase